MLVRWYFKTGFKYERRVNGQGQAIGKLCPVKSLNVPSFTPLRDRSLFIAGGWGVGAEVLGLNKVKFSRSPFKCYFTDSCDPP